MLNPDPKKLRAIGIDLHSKTRRRGAVVLTIGVFMVAMALISAETNDSTVLQRYHLGFWLMLFLSTVCCLGIFREGGPVKAFNEPVWRLKGMKDGAVLLRSLDDLAEYRFGGIFDALTDAQQSEVLSAYRVGNYFFPASSSKASTRLDERERTEKDRAYSATLTLLTRYLFIMAGVYGFKKTGFSPADITALLLTFGFFALNGPKIAILWNEPSPNSDGELRLLRGSQDGTTIT
jgi:hypothetical protein